MLSPFVFSFYFLCLIGGFVCASVFKTGCRMDGYWHTDLPNGYEIESIGDGFDRDGCGGRFMGTLSLFGSGIGWAG